jgi:hypothetical protein
MHKLCYPLFKFLNHDELSVERSSSFSSPTLEIFHSHADLFCSPQVCLGGNAKLTDPSYADNEAKESAINAPSVFLYRDTRISY